MKPTEQENELNVPHADGDDPRFFEEPEPNEREDPIAIIFQDGVELRLRIPHDVWYKLQQSSSEANMSVGDYILRGLPN
mgnify:CR=1 FL=1